MKKIRYYGRRLMTVLLVGVLLFAPVLEASADTGVNPAESVLERTAGAEAGSSEEIITGTQADGEAEFIAGTEDGSASEEKAGGQDAPGEELTEESESQESPSENTVVPQGRENPAEGRQTEEDQTEEDQEKLNEEEKLRLTEEETAGAAEEEKFRKLHEQPEEKKAQQLAEEETAQLTAEEEKVQQPAEEEKAQKEIEKQETIGISVPYINPVYRELAEEGELELELPEAEESRDTEGSAEEELLGTLAVVSGTQYADPASAAPFLRQAFKDRQDQITVRLSGYPVSFSVMTVEHLTEISDAFQEAAFAHNGVPDEGDYLKYTMIGATSSLEGFHISGNKLYGNLIFKNIIYSCDAAQEAELGTRISGALAGLELGGKSPLQITHAINDYICEHVTYDYDHPSNNYRKYSAYAAMVDGKAVCQGYTALFYRMMLAAGLSCRIVSGIGNGGAHSWNLVKMGTLWYYMDVTWNDSTGVRDRFFLKGSSNFTDHQIDTKMYDAAFFAAHPVCVHDYDGTDPGTVAVASVSLDKTNASITAGDTLALTAAVLPDNATNKAVSWESSDTSVATVDSSGKVTTIKAGTAVVTVTTQDGGKTASCTISVLPKAADWTAMYRLYNPYSYEHFYTANVGERDHLDAIGWDYEGIAWLAPTTAGDPVYRLYNPYSSDHHYTTSAEERDNCVAVGWIYEGIGWLSATTPDRIGLHRLFNPYNLTGAGTHHYTNSGVEKDHLVSLGWVYEGIAWYGLNL